MSNGKPIVGDFSDEDEARVQAGIAKDPDHPEWTDADFARARPASEVLPPALYTSLTRAQPRSRAEAKVPIRSQLDRDIVAHFKAGGADWQAWINDVLRETMQKSR